MAWFVPPTNQAISFGFVRVISLSQAALGMPKGEQHASLFGGRLYGDDRDGRLRQIQEDRIRRLG
jgi:hypothetical protein